MKTPILAFDVNETLLSLAPIKAKLEAIFGADPPVGEWFARMLHGSLVANAMDNYRPFGDIGVEALLTVAVKRGLSLRGEEAVDAVAEMMTLPPHPDVPDALKRLFEGGYVMVALTNGSTVVATDQIENAGLTPFLHKVISVEEVGRFKPDPAPYHHAAAVMGIPIGDLTLVAAHDWDCAGATAAGAGTVFVKRPGAVWSIPTDMPDVVVGDIADLADLLLA
ncbi:MAG: haloacid dehalogenase type II [Acidimicrobiia bacterium]